MPNSLYTIQRFRCYLEGGKLEIFTDNQVLRFLFSKAQLSRRESRWLDFFGQFGIIKIVPVQKKITHTRRRLVQNPLTNNFNNSSSILCTSSTQLVLPDGFTKNIIKIRLFGSFIDFSKAMRLRTKLRKIEPCKWKIIFCSMAMCDHTTDSFMFLESTSRTS